MMKHVVIQFAVFAEVEAETVIPCLGVGDFGEDRGEVRKGFGVNPKGDGERGFKKLVGKGGGFDKGGSRERVGGSTVEVED